MRLQSLWTVFERLLHGALVGGFLGTLAGLIEYLLLFREHMTSMNPAKAYWDIVPAYAVIGIIGGLLAALMVRPLLGAAPLGRQLVGLFAVVIAGALFCYVAITAVYWFGPPFPRARHLAALLGAAALAVVVGFVLQRGLVAALGRMEGGSRRSTRLLRVNAPAALAVLIAVLLVLPTAYLAKAHSSQPPWKGFGKEGAGAQQPNIVFILIDALRADHLPIYGYSRNTAPNLTELARRGMTFTRMYTQAPWTKPSVATILSSLYPSVHKVTRDRDFLSDSVTVLPEVLRPAGYRTFGISANANVSPTFGYSQGFDQFTAWKVESALRLTMLGRVAQDTLRTRQIRRLLREKGDISPTADVLTDLTLRWVTQQTQGPLFLYVHYIDPHTPYAPPAPYDKAFDHRRDRPRRQGGVDPLTLIAPPNLRGLELLLSGTNPAEDDPTRVGRIIDLYDGEILYADLHVARLLKGLGDLGVLDNAIVVVTSDHGEEFYEHGNSEHGKSAFEEVARVPFLLFGPPRVPAGVVVDQLHGLIDVMPTLLALAGVEPPAGLQGISFADRLTGNAPALANRKIFTQAITDAFALEMARDARYKLVRHTQGPRRGQEEFYDLEQDPLERANIAAPPPVAAALRQDLEAFNKLLATAAGRINVEQVKKLDAATERALRSLGYIK